jgi:hypothetical protein
MAVQTVDSVFGQAWKLLKSNLSIVVPGLVIGALEGLLEGIFSPSPEASGAGAAFGNLITSIVGLIGAILSIAYTTGMAAAAWRTGRATFGDGAEAFKREGGHIFVALVGLTLIGTAAAFLAPFTFGLSIVAFGFFCIYVMPSAIVGEREGFAAIAESAKIAYERVGPTLLIIVVMFALAVAGAFGAALFAFVPFLGPIVAAVIVEAVLAYFTLVVVGEYLALRKPDPVA